MKYECHKTKSIRKGKRKIIRSNLPFSQNITKLFFKMVHKNFPRNYQLRKISDLNIINLSQ